MLLILPMLLALLLLPAALAEETLPSVHVILGDGEPIGYFDGFEGNFLQNGDSVKGVTGRLSLSYEVEGYITQNGQRKMRVDLENITLTDDVMVLYYRLSQDKCPPIRSRFGFPPHVGNAGADVPAALHRALGCAGRSLSGRAPH